MHKESRVKEERKEKVGGSRKEVARNIKEAYIRVGAKKARGEEKLKQEQE